MAYINKYQISRLTTIDPDMLDNTVALINSCTHNNIDGGTSNETLDIAIQLATTDLPTVLMAIQRMKGKPALFVLGATHSGEAEDEPTAREMWEFAHEEDSFESAITELLYARENNVKGEDGEAILDWETATTYMDDEIREHVHAEFAPCTNQEFFDHYCHEHRMTFGECFTSVLQNVG